MLRFSNANTKIVRLYGVSSLEVFLGCNRKIYSFDLLSGWSCPFAKDCLSKVHVIDGKKKVVDSPTTKFRCFSASQEALYPPVYKMRKNNFDTLRACKDTESMVELLQSAMPKDLGVCRIHVAGDFFNQNYFDAWVTVAENNPDRLFYAYTKSIKYWLEYKYLTDNMILTASLGGRDDELIAENNLRTARVVLSEKEAKTKGLEIDTNEVHAANPSRKDESFALLIHGIQPKGTKYAKAVYEIKKRKAKT